MNLTIDSASPAKLGRLVSIETGRLNSNAAKPQGRYPFFTCSQETFRTDTYSFDCEAVLLAGNNAAGIYPLKYFSGKFDVYQRTYVLQSKDRTHSDNRYLYYYLRPKLELLKSISTGAATKFLTMSILQDLDVIVPPIPTQRKIAAVLSAYDDLIENNTRRIKILEEMAQMIYREWFVNFHFPGHEKVKMVDSAMGKIPEGWEVAQLGDLVEFVNNNPKRGADLSHLPYVPIDCIPRRSIALNDYKPGREAKSSLILFKKGDFLFGAMRPYFHKIVVAPFDGVTRKTCFIFTTKVQENYSFTLLTLFDDRTVDFANSHSRGSTIPYAVWRGSMERMRVVVPPCALASAFNEIVRPMIDHIINASFRHQTLRKTRDLLLPKLISGEVDVSELDIQTESVDSRFRGNDKNAGGNDDGSLAS